MTVKIISIVPDFYNVGITTCTIAYKVKSSNPGTGEISFELAGSNKIWFLENGRKTKNLKKEPKVINSSYIEYTKVTKIEVTEKSDHIMAAFIKIDATDSSGSKASNMKGIKHE